MTLYNWGEVGDHDFVQLVTAEVEGCLLQQRCAVELPVTAEVEGCLLQHKCAAELCLLQQQQWAVRATCYSRLCLLHQRCSRDCASYTRGAAEVCLLHQRCSRRLPVTPEVQQKIACYTRGAAEDCLLHQRCSRRLPVTKEACRRTAPFEGYMLQQNIRIVP